jgi:enoyl-CoA hydratase/carnithine racemase
VNKLPARSPENAVSIDVQDNGPVRLIAFDRPQVRNAFDIAMYDESAAAIERAGHDDRVRVVVLTGRGTAFSSGQDLGEMARLASGQTLPTTSGGFRGFIDALERCAAPVLAAVNGVAVGVGFTMLAHCDLVLVDEQARLRAPFAELGVPPEGASSLLFPARLGRQTAARVLLGAEWLDAEEAVAAGLALRRCPSGTVLAETMALAARLAEHPPEAMREIKRLMNEPWRVAVREARRREDEAFSRLLGGAALEQHRT